MSREARWIQVVQGPKWMEDINDVLPVMRDPGWILRGDEQIETRQVKSGESLITRDDLDQSPLGCRQLDQVGLVRRATD